MLNTTHQEIVALRHEIRRVVAMVLRSSRYYTDDHVKECMSDVMLQMLDYGARTFDPSKGSAKSHFTTFAKNRARNWLHMACRRFEVADEYTTGDDGETASHTAAVAAEGDPAVALVTAQEIARVRAALESLEGRERDLVDAFLRLGSWLLAAREIGVSPATASRMKAAIVAKLR
jgi:DNA-directed RNA polymerase specialized sigma24 family protein